jgi:hypothetical protein
MRVLTIVLLAPLLFAATDGQQPKPPTLTDAQRAAIYAALYDAESLKAAREAIAKADKDLQSAMQACGEGWVVARDEARNLVCVAAPKPQAKPAEAPKGK